MAGEIADAVQTAWRDLDVVQCGANDPRQNECQIQVFPSDRLQVTQVLYEVDDAPNCFSSTRDEKVTQSPLTPDEFQQFIQHL